LLSCTWDAVLSWARLQRDELQKLYEGAAVYVYPAPEEDFGMGVIESMAKGVPWWRGTRPDRLLRSAGTGHLAEPLVVSDYAGNHGLAGRSGRQPATGERAFEWARRFDWERHLDTLERAVLDVARSHEQVAAEAATA
jgi:glycosyltransferase involved in cell wall biosynthesis